MTKNIKLILISIALLVSIVVINISYVQQKEKKILIDPIKNQNRFISASDTPPAFGQLPLFEAGCGNIAGAGKVDPKKIIKDQGLTIVLNQLLVTFPKDTSCTIVDEVIGKVNGKIIGFVPSPDMYQIELPITSLEELERAEGIIEKDSRIISVGKHHIFGLE
jgi:hypothetical protein